MLKEQSLDEDELFLLILYYTQGHYCFKTRLIKFLFIFKEIIPVNEKYEFDLDFIPYNYGPYLYSNEYSLMLVRLQNYDAIEVKEIRINDKLAQKIILSESIIPRIKNNMLPNKNENKLDLIEKFCRIFDNSELNELLQFVYYLSKEYTEKSEIKEKIFGLKKNKLQEKVIQIFQKIRVRYLIKFLEYSDEILNIFNINEKVTDFYSFKEIFELFRDGLKKNNLNKELKGEIIDIIDSLCLEDNKYRRIKNSLLKSFLRPNFRGKIFEFDNKFIISTIIFLLRSFQYLRKADKSNSENYHSLEIEYYKDPTYFYSPRLEFKKPSEEEGKSINNFDYDAKIDDEIFINENEYM